MATEYAFGRIVTDGLVLSLDAADRNSYPGTGTVWTDLSGNGYTGTLTLGPTFNSSNGGSIVFDGTDDNVNFGNIFNYTTESFTFGMFIFLTATPSANAFSLISKGTFNTNGYTIFVNNILQLGLITNQSGAFQLTTGTVNGIPINNWAYATVTRSGTSCRTYVNGVDGTTNIGTHTNPTSSSTNFTISLPSTSVITGRVANLQAYNRALSSAEVLQNYNAQKSRFGL